MQREVSLDNPTVSLEQTMVAMQKAQIGFAGDAAGQESPGSGVLGNHVDAGLARIAHRASRFSRIASVVVEH